MNKIDNKDDYFSFLDNIKQRIRHAQYEAMRVDKKLQPLVAEIYLNVINDTMRLPHENPALGIIICKSKNRTVVEYALRNSTIPIGVATYSISPNLPDDYKNLLPEADKIAERLRNLEASAC